MQKYKILATLLAFVLALSMLTVVSVAADSITITASDATVKEGADSASVTFKVSDNPGIALLGFDIEYDSDYFTISGVEVYDEVFGASQITVGDLNANPYYFLANSKTENVSGNGKLITITFDIGASCPTGTYEITMNNDGVKFPPEAYDKNLNAVNMVFENGSVIVEEEIEKTEEIEETEETEEIEVKEMTFADVDVDAWYFNAVAFVYVKGITNGVSETEFAPDGKVTRGQFITMLCRAYGIEKMDGDNFADCGDTWYTGYLAAAKQLGIANGVGDNMFAPERFVTREEMVTLLYNYYKSQDMAGEEAAETGFADDALVSAWAKAAVAYASEEGIINGKGGNMFDPRGNATRAELAQIFYNIFARGE